MPEHQHPCKRAAGLRDLSQSIRLAAVAMLTVFVLAMLSSVLSKQLDPPTWQLAIVVALLALHLAARLNPCDDFNAELRDGASRWAVQAAAGFLLLFVPQQFWNRHRLQRAEDQQLALHESRAQQRFNPLHQAVADAASPTDL